MRVDREEVVASLQFFSLVLVLVLLPNEELDVLFGLNSQRVWLVVVSIAGLSYVGYLLAKAVDPRTAIGVTGVVGGGVSPGLTIISFLEQTKRCDDFDRTYACAAAIAVTMMFPRDYVVFGIVSSSLARFDGQSRLSRFDSSLVSFVVLRRPSLVDAEVEVCDGGRASQVRSSAMK